MSGSKARRASAGGPLLFVYGTLRMNARGPVQAALTQGWSFVGYGTVAADLYDLGAHPGAVRSATASARVRGELYRVPSEPHTLARLDYHEGDEFERASVDVTLDSGDAESAWIYWYRGEPSGRRIRSGDYLGSPSHGARRGDSTRSF
jgi:gamma-glutamylcyclotransferase (GGCT)/AIG2-like uncharacterized protein YtfP